MSAIFTTAHDALTWVAALIAVLAVSSVAATVVRHRHWRDRGPR